ACLSSPASVSQQEPSLVAPHLVKPPLQHTSTLSSNQWIRQCSEKELSRLQVYDILPAVSRTRLALIINNMEFENPQMMRRGADVDQNQMQKLLEGFGYKVETAKNLSAQEMGATLSTFSQRDEHLRSDSTFVVVMSHGLRDKICGRLHCPEREDTLHTDNIFNTLNNQNCKGLRGKPKVIIIQACRGGEWLALTSLEPPADYEEDAPFYQVHKESDFICLCSSTPDNVSFRDVNKGSILIQHIIEVMRENAWKDHIEELFSKVQRKFTDFKRQIPAKERSTLIKKFYLFPGF
uniref:Caspase-1-like protein n=1 Tax=Callorhinchus milii TaxID=7868 RepID=A0A4W3I5I4_CALMI